jgi:hypothetical protein
MRPVLSAVIALAALLAPACSGQSGSSSSEATRCLYRDVFAALDELRGVAALCPTWLPDDVRPTYINAKASAEYVVNFEPLGMLFPHVVLELAEEDPPGHRIGEADVRSRTAAIHFEPSRSSGPAGLHSGHYIVAFAGTSYQRGSYWVSIHEDSQRSRQVNIERVLKIARSLRPVRR